MCNRATGAAATGMAESRGSVSRGRWRARWQPRTCLHRPDLRDPLAGRDGRGARHLGVSRRIKVRCGECRARWRWIDGWRCGLAGGGRARTSPTDRNTPKAKRSRRRAPHQRARRPALRLAAAGQAVVNTDDNRGAGRRQAAVPALGICPAAAPSNAPINPTHNARPQLLCVATPVPLLSSVPCRPRCSGSMGAQPSRA